MKVNTEQIRSVKMVLEMSEEEARLLKSMFSYDCSIPELLYKSAGPERDKLTDLMGEIHLSLVRGMNK